MIKKKIGKEDNGAVFLLYDIGKLQIQEVIDDDGDFSVHLSIEETKELKMFLDENLK